MAFPSSTMARFAFLGAALGWAAVPGQAQTTLRYQFKEGDKIRYAIESKTETQAKIMDKDVTTTTTQSQDMTWHVVSVAPDGKAKIKLRFGRLRFTTEGLGIKKVIDSADTKETDDPAQKPLRAVFKAMAEADFSLTMTAAGEMTDLTVPESFRKAIQDAPGGEALGDAVAGDELKRLLNQGGLVVPRQAVTRGKSWEQKSEAKLPLGKLKTKQTYTYQGPITRAGQKLEQIDLVSSLTLEADPNAPFQVGLKNAEGKGVAYFDNSAGRLVELSLTQNMQIEITAMDQKVLQNFHQNVSLKLQDGK